MPRRNEGLVVGDEDRGLRAACRATVREAPSAIVQRFGRQSGHHATILPGRARPVGDGRGSPVARRGSGDRDAGRVSWPPVREGVGMRYDASLVKGSSHTMIG